MSAVAATPLTCANRLTIEASSASATSLARVTKFLTTIPQYDPVPEMCSRGNDQGSAVRSAPRADPVKLNHILVNLPHRGGAVQTFFTPSSGSETSALWTQLLTSRRVQLQVSVITGAELRAGLSWLQAANHHDRGTD